MRSSDMPTPKDPQQTLQDAITDMQARRAVRGDTLVDAVLAPLARTPGRAQRTA